MRIIVYVCMPTLGRLVLMLNTHNSTPKVQKFSNKQFSKTFERPPALSQEATGGYQSAEQGSTP